MWIGNVLTTIRPPLKQWIVHLDFYLVHLFVLFGCMWWFCFVCLLVGCLFLVFFFWLVVFFWFLALTVLRVPIAALLLSSEAHLYCIKIICLPATAWVEMKRVQHALLSQCTNRRKKDVLQLLLRKLFASEGAYSVDVPGCHLGVSSLLSPSFSVWAKQECSSATEAAGRCMLLPGWNCTGVWTVSYCEQHCKGALLRNWLEV